MCLNLISEGFLVWSYLAHANLLDGMVDEASLVLKHGVDAIDVQRLELAEGPDFRSLVGHWTRRGHTAGGFFLAAHGLARNVLFSLQKGFSRSAGEVLCEKESLERRRDPFFCIYGPLSIIFNSTI